MSAGGLRPLRWTDVPRAASMMGAAYTAKALPAARPRIRAAAATAASLAFGLSLAIYRPLVRYWRDPADARRQTVLAVIPRGRTVIPVFRLFLGLALYGIAVLAGSSPASGALSAVLAALSLLAVLAGLVICPAVLAAVWLLSRPYEGRITRSGPRVPGTQLTAGLAASSSAAGMLAARADLTARHGGQRLTVRARDVDALNLYRRLGLEVVEAGCGRMTGLVPAAG